MLLTWTFANSTPWQISISNYELNCTASFCYYCYSVILQLSQGSVITDPMPQPAPAPANDPALITFQVIEGGSRRQNQQLVDSRGYSYNIASKRSYATYWQCTHRPNKDNKCRASVVQRNGNFTIGSQQHNHNAESDKAAKIKIVAAIKKKALEEKFMPAFKIVNEVNQSESTLFTLFLCMEVSELYV